MDTRVLAVALSMLGIVGCHAGETTRDAAVEQALAWALKADYLTVMDELCSDGRILVVGPTTLRSAGDCAIEVTTDEGLRSAVASRKEALPYVRIGEVKEAAPDRWLVDLELAYVPPPAQKEPLLGGGAWVTCEVRRGLLGWRVRALEGTIS